MSNKKQSAQQYWDERSELFSNYYEKPTLFDRIFRKAVYTRVAVSVKTTKDLNAETLLDIGSGPGNNSINFLKNTNIKHLTGIDFADNMVAHAVKAVEAEGLTSKADFILGDFRTHEFGKTFDCCIAMGVLDYIEGADEFVKRMATHTNKAFVISWPEDGLRMALRRKRYDCPVYHYDRKGIEKFHENCGVSKLEFVTTPGGWVTIAYK